MTLFFAIILGLIVGSFLNAVIYRLHKGRSFISGRSVCPNCQNNIRGYDLIPLLSFVILKGKCRDCHNHISWQYPLVEALTACVFGLFVTNYSISLELGIALAFASIFILIAVYDSKHYIILDKVLLFFGILAIAWNIYEGVLFQGLFSGLGVMAFFAIQYFLSQGRWIGFGDVKLGFVFGNILLWPGSLVGLFLAYVLGAVLGIALILTGKKHLTSHLPMGTFLSIGAIITMLYGQQIASWYLKLIGF